VAPWLGAAEAAEPADPFEQVVSVAGVDTKLRDYLRTPAFRGAFTEVTASWLALRLAHLRERTGPTSAVVRRQSA
jgi:hypothetical protein